MGRRVNLSKGTTLNAALHQHELYDPVEKQRWEWRDRSKTSNRRSLRLWDRKLFECKTKIELFGLSMKPHVCRKLSAAHHLPNTMHTMKHGGGSLMLWGSFPAEEGGRLVKVERKLNGAKCNEILNENTAVETSDRARRFNLQLDNDLKHTTMTVPQCLRSDSLNALEWLSQNPDLTPIKHL